MGKPMVETLHKHDFFYILALKKASGLHTIDFKSYELRDNALFFMRPSQVHQIQLDAEAEGYMLHFYKDFFHSDTVTINTLIRKAGSTHFFVFNEEGYARIDYLMTHSYKEFLNKEVGHLNLIRNNLYSLLIELSRVNQSIDSNRMSNYNQEKLDLFYELLDQHIDHKKQVSDYAELMNLSRYQLNSIVQ